MNTSILKLFIGLTLIPSLVSAKPDAGVGPRASTSPQSAEEKDEDREEENEAAREAQEAAREAGEAAREAREEAKQAARAARQVAKEHMKAAREQMREMARHMREMARQQQTMSLYPRLGVVVNPDQDSAEASKGAVVDGVLPGSPAEKAGIQSGDVLTAINGQPLLDSPDGGLGSAARSVAKLLAVVHEAKPGDKVKVDYLRHSKKWQAEVTLQGGEHGWMSFAKHARTHDFFHGPSSWSDVELVEMNRDLGEYFGTDHGLLVVCGSNAPKLQLKGGDVILRIGQEEPRTPVEAVRLLRSYEGGKSISLQILRHKQPQTVTIHSPSDER